MEYKELISNAIEKDEVVKLLRGEGEYEVVVSEFTSDIFPTDVNSVLINCFYKQNGNIRDIEKIFNNALNDLIKGNASDVYIAVLYFDSCIFQEEKGKANFPALSSAGCCYKATCRCKSEWCWKEILDSAQCGQRKIQLYRMACSSAHWT